MPSIVSIPRHLWIVNIHAAPRPSFQAGLFSTWMFNQLTMAALISGSAIELSEGVRWWKCSSEYHNMIRVINIVWCDREANLPHSVRRMQISCLWWMPLLSKLTYELNKSASAKFKSIAFTRGCQGLWNICTTLSTEGTARTNGSLWQGSLKPSSHPPIPLFIKTEVGHLQNGCHLATLSVPLPVSICFSQVPANKMLLNNTLTQSTLKTGRQEIYCPYLRLFSICIPQPIFLCAAFNYLS